MGRNTGTNFLINNTALFLRDISRLIFHFHTALKTISKYSPSTLGCASSFVFALFESKISARAKPLILFLILCAF